MEKYVLQFNPQELAVLNKALVQLPYAEVAPIIGIINQQLSAQDTEKKQPPESDE